MMNPFVIKKFSALILTGLLPCVGLAVTTIFYGYWWGLGMMGFFLLLSMMISVLLLRNPFSVMLEGKGLLAIDINSSGVLRMFNMSVNMPHLHGKYNKKVVKDVFDRDAVFQVAKPTSNPIPATVETNGNIKIELDEEKYNQARFALFHYPCVIYNSAIGSIMTKDVLSGQEKESFAKHGIMALNHKVEDLSNHIRDFARHTVELTRPREKWYQNKWVIVIIVVLLAILGIALFPKVVQIIGAAMSTTAEAVSNKAVTPK